MPSDKLNRGNYKILEKKRKPSVLRRLLQRNKHKKEHIPEVPLELEIQKALLSYVSTGELSSVKDAEKEFLSTQAPKKSGETKDVGSHDLLTKYLSKQKMFLSNIDLSKNHQSVLSQNISKSLSSGLNVWTTDELLSNWTSKKLQAIPSLQNLLMLPKIPPDVAEIEEHDGVLCRMCLSVLSSEDMYSLEGCASTFCFLCMKQYLTINILEGTTNITCPDPACGKNESISEHEIEKLVDSEIFKKYKRYKLNEEIEKDVTRCWCPNPRCDSICLTPSSSERLSVTCASCDFTFCSLCKESWHPTTPCRDKDKNCRYIDKSLSSSSSYAVSKSIIKQCPGCSVPIERNEGCAQMKCRCCKHIFCWHCLSLLDDDVLLRHFDKGPCKNKLGHSRISLMCHRIRVIITIIGLSALLAALSPLLLISLPFLLCF